MSISACPTVFIHHFHALGALAIVISLATWAVDLAQLVYACPYCRAQRTVIGLLGGLLLLPDPRHWLSRYLAAVFAVFAVFGLVVAGMQHFNGWKKIHRGEFQLSEHWYVDSFLLSGAAIFIIVGLVLLIFTPRENVVR